MEADSVPGSAASERRQALQCMASGGRGLCGQGLPPWTATEARRWMAMRAQKQEQACRSSQRLRSPGILGWVSKSVDDRRDRAIRPLDPLLIAAPIGAGFCDLRGQGIRLIRDHVGSASVGGRGLVVRLHVTIPRGSTKRLRATLVRLRLGCIG